MDVICSDDVSINSTGSLLDAIAEQYPDSVRVFYLPENRKQGGAKNVGLAMPRGNMWHFWRQTTG